MATVALSTLRGEVQLFVKDTTANKWTAADLNTMINMAVVQWTTDVPIASSTPYDVVTSQHAYVLPDNATDVRFVQGYFETTTEEEFLAPMQIATGIWPTSNEPRRFIAGFPTEGQFYLPRLPLGTSFTLHYGAVHNKLVDDQDTLDLRLHHWGEQAVVFYTCYLAYLPYAARRARSEQWARRPEIDVGNPLAEEAERWLRRYEELLRAHSEPTVWEFVRLDRT